MSHALIRLALVKMFKLPVNFLCISSEILNEKTHLHSFLTNLADVSFCPSNEWDQSSSESSSLQRVSALFWSLYAHLERL